MFIPDMYLRLCGQPNVCPQLCSGLRLNKILCMQAPDLTLTLASIHPGTSAAARLPQQQPGWFDQALQRAACSSATVGTAACTADEAD
jgi:hypothetical protein